MAPAPVAQCSLTGHSWQIGRSGAADQRAEIEQRVVELRVGPVRAGQPVEIKSQLPASLVLSIEEPAGDSRRVGVDQHRALTEAEAEHRLGDVVADARQRAQLELVVRDDAAEVLDQRSRHLDHILGPPPKTQRSHRLQRLAVPS